MGLSGLPSREELEQMFGFVTPEDRARWGQRNTPEQPDRKKQMFAKMVDGLADSGQRIAGGGQRNPPEQPDRKKQMFAKMVDGLADSGQRIADGRLRAEQTGRSVNRAPRKVTRMITEHIRAEEDLDAPYEY